MCAVTDQLSRVFQALADPTRRDLVARLATADATVGELAAPYDVSLQAVSKHLKVLEDAGLVTKTRDAQRRPVHLEAEVFDLMTKWITRYQREAEERFQRLDALLARMDDDQAAPTDPRSPTKRRTSVMSTTQSTGNREATIVPDPDVPKITITREFDAPPERVYRAWAEPDLVQAVAGPDASVDMNIEEWDCRTGGSYRYSASHDGEESARFYGSFHEARPGERLVQTFT